MTRAEAYRLEAERVQQERRARDPYGAEADAVLAELKRAIPRVCACGRSSDTSMVLIYWSNEATAWICQVCFFKGGRR